MEPEIHPLAPEHLPVFLPGPDGSDPFFIYMIFNVVLFAVLFGAFYFSLHALPEKMAHKKNTTQLQLIGVLSLIALFTHQTVFWILALLVAAINIPDFTTPLRAIAEALDRDRGAPPEPAQTSAGEGDDRA